MDCALSLLKLNDNLCDMFLQSSWIPLLNLKNILGRNSLFIIGIEIIMLFKLVLNASLLVHLVRDFVNVLNGVDNLVRFLFGLVVLSDLLFEF